MLILYPFKDASSGVSNYNSVLLSYDGVISKNAFACYVFLRELASRLTKPFTIDDSLMPIPVEIVVELEQFGLVKSDLSLFTPEIIVNEVYPLEGCDIYKVFPQLAESGSFKDARKTNSQIAKFVIQFYKTYLHRNPDRRDMGVGMIVMKRLIKRGYKLEEIRKTLDWIVGRGIHISDLTSIQYYIQEALSKVS